MNVVIYARYSSHQQTEQSIEGQLEVCYSYARENQMIVVGEYIDRAMTGQNNHRPQFQRMMKDSNKHTFQAVLVYQLDRFSRNRYDSAVSKHDLKKNGVRVISAREQISTDASGILIESVLEGMAEYYSAELSQKVQRGMQINAEKHLSNGSVVGLGFKVDADRRYQIDPDTAPVVKKIFEKYAQGVPVADIVRNLNARQIKTARGNEFNKNSLHRMLCNPRYIGTYVYKGKETPDVIPQIIDKALFQRVQDMLAKSHTAPARARGQDEYLLTTKLYCGYCKERMTGYCGTSRNGRVYHYYVCNGKKKKMCKKKAVRKEAIENRVMAFCYAQLTDTRISQIATAVAAACKAGEENREVKRLRGQIREMDKKIEHLCVALEEGSVVDVITAQIQKRQLEKEKMEKQLADANTRAIALTAEEVTAFLKHFKNGEMDNFKNRRTLVNIFLQAVYLFDDHMTLYFNGSDHPITVNAELTDKVESGTGTFVAQCSSFSPQSPP